MTHEPVHPVPSICPDENSVTRARMRAEESSRLVRFAEEELAAAIQRHNAFET